ncbi:MAG: AEC family transporter [Clostridia bacterium]|nr:AEC family transporter [Clostridia bacterium]
MIFKTVLLQVVVLFILIFTGFFLTKKHILTKLGTKSITDVVLLIVTPCVIIKSFINTEYSSKTLKGLLLSFLAAVIVHLIFIILSTVMFRDNDVSRKRVLRFAAIFGNCGFMSLPIQETILGSTGLLYGASFVAIFNLFAWSYGIVEMSGDKKNKSVKKIVLNPCILSIVIGVIIFFAKIPVPKMIKLPVEYFAALNTPLPMLIIGYHLAKLDFKVAIKDFRCLFCSVSRLFILPAVGVGAIYLLGFWVPDLRGDLLVSIAISACSPAAAYTAIFAYKFKQNTDLAVNLVSLSTLLSLITMPIIIGAAQMLA